jgi:spoIIIJ-associated protein
MATDTPAAEHPIESYLTLLESVLRSFLDHSPFKLSFSIQKAVPHPGDPDTPEYIVDFSGPDADLLVEMNATLLHAIEHVVLKAIRLDDDHFRSIVFDCRDWRRMRIEELQLMAQVASERVIDTGSPFTLNAMSPRERRIIHLALKDQPRVRTQSEGVGSERKVVIFPAR